MISLMRILLILSPFAFVYVLSLWLSRLDRRAEVKRLHAMRRDA